MSQVKIQLSEVWDECPAAFRHMMNNLYHPDGYESDDISMIKQELRKSNGRFCIESDTIVFPSEADYTSWLLRWG